MNKNFVYRNSANKYVSGTYVTTRVLDGDETIWEMSDGSFVKKTVSEIPISLTEEQTITFLENINSYLRDECTIIKDKDSDGFYLNTANITLKVEFFHVVIVEDVEFNDYLNINIVSHNGIFLLNKYQVENIFKLVKHAYFQTIYGWEKLRVDADGNLPIEIDEFYYLPDFHQMISYLQQNNIHVKQINRDRQKITIIGFDDKYNSLKIYLYDFDYVIEYNGVINQDEIKTIVENITKEEYDNLDYENEKENEEEYFDDKDFI
jgi:hypothetical protein